MKAAIESLLGEQPGFTSGELAERAGKSRQAVHRHLTRWLEAGWLVREGQGRATRYRRGGGEVFARSYSTSGLEEHRVWEDVRGAVPELDGESARNADAVLSYAVTEIVNNAIDHSRAEEVEVRVERKGELLRLTIADTGVGAFENVRERFALPDQLSALQELSKGKVTTAPETHTGEGIFFTSKMVDHFELGANGLVWIVDNRRKDQAVVNAPERPGTTIQIELALDTETRPVEVFGRYTHDFEFDTTRGVVKLFEHGLRFVSRSEAKRLTTGLERFREVILDFRGVEGVGQGFVDQIFRVWAAAHPEVRLVPENMAEPVAFMVERGLSAS